MNHQNLIFIQTKIEEFRKIFELQTFTIELHDREIETETISYFGKADFSMNICDKSFLIIIKVLKDFSKGRISQLRLVSSIYSCKETKPPKEPKEEDTKTPKDEKSDSSARKKKRATTPSKTSEKKTAPSTESKSKEAKKPEQKTEETVQEPTNEEQKPKDEKKKPCIKKGNYEECGSELKVEFRLGKPLPKYDKNFEKLAILLQLK